MYKIRFLALSLLLPFLFSSCAGMEQAYKNEHCNREKGYERGMNDGRADKPMDSGFASPCDPETRRAVMQGYREGYETARKQAEEPGVKADENGIRVKVPGVDISIPTQRGRKWSCEVQAFGQTFTGFGSSRAAAAEEARSQCGKRYHSMHCGHLSCEQGG